MRELDERLGLNQLTEEHLTDDRRGKNTQLPLPDLLRQSLYSRLAGYEDVNDAERLWQDPTFRLIGSAKIRERGAALPSRLDWFPSFPLEPGAARAKPAGLQPGQPVAAAGSAEEDRELVADEFATTPGEDRRATGETYTLLLASSGRRTSDAAVWGDAGSYRTAADRDGIERRAQNRSTG